MTATPTGITTFSVVGQSLRCDRPGCGYTSPLGTAGAGRPCRVCAAAGFAGKLEPMVYAVDLAELDGNGWCSCHDFEKRHQPLWQRLTPPERKETPPRCKHIKDVRAQVCHMTGKTEAELDAWLAALPDQSQEAQP